MADTNYDTQNYIRIPWISCSLLFRESATCIESIGAMEWELYIFIPCHRGFTFGFTARVIFLLLFFRLVKAISTDQLQMLGMQQKAALGRAGVLQVRQICTGTISRKEVVIYN